ncbi:hypothetical protein JNUCC42_12510 [Brevibacterium sp. JNUCC-42]|nr:hypothetical protein JNUCC42_12510 [Brevibacterium sp. JNUCC-42]
MLDIETTKGLQASQITAFCLAFLTHIKARTDKAPILYTGASFAKPVRKRNIWAIWLTGYVSPVDKTHKINNFEQETSEYEGGFGRFSI